MTAVCYSCSKLDRWYSLLEQKSIF